MKRPTITIYCTCGMTATLTFHVGTPLAQQQRAASRVLAAGHTGEGHAPCDKWTADAARRKKEVSLGIYRFGY